MPLALEILRSLLNVFIHSDRRYLILIHKVRCFMFLCDVNFGDFASDFTLLLAIRHTVFWY